MSFILKDFDSIFICQVYVKFYNNLLCYNIQSIKFGGIFIADPACCSKLL